MPASDYYQGDETREKRPTVLKGIFFLFILILVVAGLLYGALQLRSAEGPKVAFAAPEPLTVSVMPVRLASEFRIDESFTGLAEARRKSQLGFSSGGRIEAISADVGDRVKAGETLARLDTRSLTAQLASARAMVEEARAGHALALNTVERQRTLKLQGHVSQQHVDEAEAQANTSLARIDAAKAQADTLRVQIDLARITAPFDGVVTARMADEGAISAPGQPLLELVETGHLEARIGLPAVSAARLVPGNFYSLVADTGTVDAKLRTVTGVIDPDQRTVAAMFDIENPGILAVGAVVRLSMEREIDEPGFWVPVKAMSTASRGLWMVYVAAPYNGGWRAEPRPVEMVHSEGDRGFVRGPVQEGDRVIVDGLQRLAPNMPVIPRESPRADTPTDG
ncbi:efflux RND transporter periplasmic adaptor subunit [Hyphomonas johnsonii]|jgi:RND family efflux transporter MFP subunit|uniref:RND family efflux transporter MFP subunit n=1 Tax=Hyphomonas johnsonii MHS-2 TaxID=1280950 RepID=A0A059FU64_9PROT|nr:efflux RND transporter periplasmic adaptor subunit [Hyphomonas johnsonii]KCZ94142.1 RND family efflux transporter MFP subunit [Hyphomonas johnsonii MHS-2]